MSAGGYLGGHLSFAQGANVNRNAWDEGISEWTPVADEASLADGDHTVAHAGEIVVDVFQQVQSRGDVDAVALEAHRFGRRRHEPADIA